jgi:hypothetical protein
VLHGCQFVPIILQQHRTIWPSGDALGTYSGHCRFDSRRLHGYAEWVFSSFSS